MPIRSYELVPFVDSLSHTANQYFYGEELENYDFRGKLLMFATTSLWHTRAKSKVQFDTYMGEYLALMRDDPPMTEWIADWHDNVIPKMLNELRQQLESDHNELTPEMMKDISMSAKHLTTFCLPAADTPTKQDELWQTYEMTRGFFLEHLGQLDAPAQSSINEMEHLRPS